MLPLSIVLVKKNFCEKVKIPMFRIANGIMDSMKKKDIADDKIKQSLAIKFLKDRIIILNG